jgi:hypothetical protein
MSNTLRILWDTHAVVFDASKITYKEVLLFLKGFDWRTGDNLNTQTRDWLRKQPAKKMRTYNDVALYKTLDNSIYFFQVMPALRENIKLKSISQKLKSLEFALTELKNEKVPHRTYQAQWNDYRDEITTEIKQLKEDSIMAVYDYYLKGGLDIKENAFSDAKHQNLIEFGHSKIEVPIDSIYLRTTNNIDIHFSEEKQVYFFSANRYYKEANIVLLNEPRD